MYAVRDEPAITPILRYPAPRILASSLYRDPGLPSNALFRQIFSELHMDEEIL